MADAALELEYPPADARPGGPPMETEEFEALCDQLTWSLAAFLTRLCLVRDRRPTCVAAALMTAALRVAGAEMDRGAVAAWLRSTAEDLERGENA